MTREEQIEQYCKEQGCPAGACASQLVFQHNIIYAAIKWADNHPNISLEELKNIFKSLNKELQSDFILWLDDNYME